jgi:hypothetical protein
MIVLLTSKEPRDGFSSMNFIYGTN